MATVNKDFRVKHGLVVEGTNATVDGSDIITEDIITGGTQTNISVTYNPSTKLLDFVAENGVADSDTDDLAEGTTNLYFTDQRAIDAVGGSATSENTPNTVVKRDSSGNFEAEDVTVNQLTVGGSPVSTIITGYSVTSDKINLLESGSTITKGSGTEEVIYRGTDDTFIGDLKVSESGDYNYAVIGRQDTFTNKPIVRAEEFKIDDSANPLATKDLDGNVIVNANTFRSPGSKLVIASGQGVYLDDSSDNNNLVVKKGDVDDLIGDATVDGTSGDTVTDRIATAVTDHNDLTTGVHGVSGDVVGTSDAQTLTNKTMGDDLLMDGNQISGLGTPTQADHAATKSYVDATAEGLHVKPSVLAATTADLGATYDNGTNGVDATLTIPATATLNIDGQTAWEVGDGILVKNQDDAFENGRYYVVTVGDAGTAWVLKRCMACDEADEIPSAYVFVQAGSTYVATGWVALVENPETFTVGQDDITWEQFSGAGTYLAGNGLNLDGNMFSIDDTITATKTYVDETFVTLDDLPGELDDYIPLTQRAAADGVATLDENAQVPLTQLENVVNVIEDLNTTDIAEDPAYLYFTDARAVSALEAVVPNFTAVEFNSVAKQVAATVVPATGETVAYSFAKSEYRSAKFMVKVAYGTHTEVSEVLLTLDTSDNIAITEYALVGTNGTMSEISGGISGSNVQLLVTPTNDLSTITVVGTLLA